LANRGHLTPPPLEPPVLPVAIVVALIEERETWMRMIERFQKLLAPVFHGGLDPLVADR